MTDDMIALSRRAVACRGWRWMPGMLRLRVTSPGMRDYLLREGRVPDGGDPWVYEDWPVIPDLTDPATVGCILALVREAWGMPTGITVSYSSDGGLWGVSWSGATHVGWCGRGVTEAEALVAALERVA